MLPVKGVWVTLACALAVAAAWLGACDSQKTVYVKRSAGMLGLEGEVGQERFLEDGTRVVVVDEFPAADGQERKPKAAVEFVPRGEEGIPWTGGPYSYPGLTPPPKPRPKVEEPVEFELRKEYDGGRVVLSAIMPEHVLANLVECLKNKEWEPFYAQMLSDDARGAYERAGGLPTFQKWGEENRESLLIFLNRMGSNWSGTQVICEKVAPMRLRFRLDKRDIPNIRFESIEISMEHGGCRLAMVR